jgi:hypothetical protein
VPIYFCSFNGEKLKEKNIYWLLSLLIMVTLISAEVGLVPFASAHASDPPTCIHLTWGEDDTAHTIAITWKTKTENSGDVVRYGVNSGDYRFSASGSHHTYPGARGYIHDVQLTGLSPDTVYYFICGGEDGGWSGERSFRTAPDRRTSFRFVAGGDSRSGGDWPGPRDAISRAMAKFNPSFVLFTGDFVRQGDYQWEWDNWFAAVQEYWVDDDGLTIPIIPCIGNHELYGDPGGVAYYEQFSLPGIEQWYSLDWGPDLHMIVLNSETSITGKQLDWLKSDLAEHENYLWKVAIFHRPAFSGGSHGSTASIQRYWVPLFDNYHVDLVISGHDHDYERTYPINYTISDNTPMPSPENGTIYIVSGGWGAPLYAGSPQWWSARGPESKYHFTVVDIYENGMLRFRAVDRDGNIIDEFSIQKRVTEGEEGFKIPPIVIAAVAIIAACVIAIYLLRAKGESPNS